MGSGGQGAEMAVASEGRMGLRSGGQLTERHLARENARAFLTQLFVSGGGGAVGLPPLWRFTEWTRADLSLTFCDR